MKIYIVAELDENGKINEELGVFESLEEARKEATPLLTHNGIFHNVAVLEYSLKKRW